MIEVIALTVDDAVRAEAGGADRLEVVGTMADDGLSPTAATIRAMKAACSLPLRAMVRCRAGFTIDDDGAHLAQTAAELLEAGADGLVLGYLNAQGDIDLDALEAIGIDGSFAWTFHRAIDHARDPLAAWTQLVDLPGLDQVLTAGSASGVATGMDLLKTLAGQPDYRQRILVGGGLASEHLSELAAVGLGGFHLGSPVRVGRSFAEPIDIDAVAYWRRLIDAAAGIS